MNNTKNIINTLIYPSPTDEQIAIGGEIIKKGGIVVFPTETVYGLGGNALMSDAAQKIYAAKGRPSDNPLIIHLAKYEDAEQYAFTNDMFVKLANAFMPGPLTVILPKRKCITMTVTGGLDTVAVRIPSNRTAHSLLRYSGVPIAAPSANISGKPSPTRLEHVIDDMNGRVDMILGGGDCTIGLESTIVRPEKDGSLSILRPGGITYEMLETLLQGTEINDLSLHRLKPGESPPAPGMKYRHYAPNAKVIVLSGASDAVFSYMKSKAASCSVGFICHDEWAKLLGDNAIGYGSINDPEEDKTAHNLFAILREFDRHPEIETIYADMPRTDGIGRAVYNRLIKAAGFDILNIKETT